MSDKDTQYYCTIGGNYCSYCHTLLMPYDTVDEDGNYTGSHYQCNCKQGRIEQQMNNEIDLVEKQIEDIKNRYSSLLQVDWEKSNRNQYEIEVQHLKEMYGIED